MVIWYLHTLYSYAQTKISALVLYTGTCILRKPFKTLMQSDAIDSSMTLYLKGQGGGGGFCSIMDAL